MASPNPTIDDPLDGVTLLPRTESDVPMRWRAVADGCPPVKGPSAGLGWATDASPRPIPRSSIAKTRFACPVGDRMSVKLQGIRVSQREVAHLAGVSVATIRSWERAGCPVLERGSRGKAHGYDSAAVFQWRFDQVAKAAQGDPIARETEQNRVRGAVAKVAVMEMDVSARSAELAPIEEVSAAVTKEYGIVRAAFRTIPDVAPLLAGKQASEIQELLADKVNEVLTALSSEPQQ